MMQKFLSKEGIVIIAALLLLLAVWVGSGGFSLFISPSAPEAPRVSAPAPPPFSNAFVPTPTSSPLLVQPSAPPPELTPPQTKPQVSPPPIVASILSLEEVKKKVSAALGGEPSPEERLALPSVSNGEIAISSSGVKTAEDFLAYFSVHIKDVRFDGKKLDGVLKNKDEIPLLPQELVDRALGDGNFAAIHNSLLVYKDLIQAKIAYISAISVFGDAVSTSKEFIGFEKLTSELIDKTLAVESGASSKDELARFKEKLDATARVAHAELLRKAGVADKDENFFERIFAGVGKFLGLKNVSAQLATFGGTMSITEVCASQCEPGYLLTIGPPVPSVLFVSMYWYATPALFIYKSLRPGSWWLGTYTPGAIGLCEEAPYCEPIGGGVRPTIAGTSP